MGANRRRGEIAATIDGREHVLCLTLGALAELEGAFAIDDLTALAERFATGRFRARDLVRVLGAGLRGGGTAASDDEVAAKRAGSRGTRRSPSGWACCGLRRAISGR